MIVPTSEFEGLLILNPHNTTSHVFDGELFYTMFPLYHQPSQSFQRKDMMFIIATALPSVFSTLCLLLHLYLGKQWCN